MELTYNQIIKVLNDFATNHYQINEFGNGDLWEVVEHNKSKRFNYPLLWVQDQPISFTQNEIEIVLRCFLINQVHKDESNENEVKSDMLTICMDLLSFWKQQTDYRTVSIDVNTSATSFTERFNDELTGWFIDLKLTQNFRYDKCSIPMDGITPIPTNCPAATITINGESFTIAPSGGTTDIVVKNSDGDVVGSKVGNEWIVPVGGGSATVENSDQSYQETVNPDDTLVLPDITHTDSDGSPVTLPAQTPFVSTPCGPAVGDIFYNMPQPTATTSYFTDDEGTQRLNGTYDNTIPANGRVQVLQNGEFYKVQFDKESRGHLYRFLGLNGGYYNSDTDTYHLSDGTTSTKAVVFDNDFYAFDRLTGLGWVTGKGGPLTYTAALAFSEAYTIHGFTNFHMAGRFQMETILDINLTNPLNLGVSKIFRFVGAMSLASPYAVSPTTTIQRVNSTGGFATFPTASSGDFCVVRDARGQF